jgi:monoamine oxidase
MFALADMLDFLANKFAGLCRWRLTLSFRATCSFDSFLFWHKSSSFQLGQLVVCLTDAMRTGKTSDVLIIGAGAAGLAAWRELYSAGLRPVVLEARDRFGGRILTDYSAQVPLELGAEFVHGKAPAIWSILKKANLEALEIPEARVVLGRSGLRSCPEYWKIIQRVNGQIEPANDIPYEQFLAAADASRFEKRLAKSYVEGFNAARAELISTSAIAKADQAATEIEGQKQFRLRAGYKSLLDWLAEGLPRQSLHLHTEVHEIHWEKGRVRVVANTRAGERVFAAARIIVTVPLGVLQAPSDVRGAIRFIPPLSQKEAAVRYLEMGHVAKLLIGFKKRFWEAAGSFAFALSLDADMPTWWTQEPLTSNVLTGWSGGSFAEKLIYLSQADLVDRALGSLSRIFGHPKSLLREYIDTIHYHNWSNDPFSMGAYSYPKVGGLAAARILAEPVNETIFFAGEATDFQGADGTVHGAINSGQSVAQSIAGSL